MASDPRIIEPSREARLMSRISDLERRIGSLERRPTVEMTTGAPVTTPAPGSLALDTYNGELWVYNGPTGPWSGWRSTLLY